MGTCCSGESKGNSGTDGKEHDDAQQFFLVGHPGVGKTSLLYRFTDNKFPVDDSLDVAKPRMTNLSDIGDSKKTIKVTLIDTAGQEKFRTITSSFYGRSEGIIVVYDVTNKETYNQLKSWFTEIDRYATSGMLRILVGNKIDLLDSSSRAVSKEDAEQLADSNGVQYFETSAKTAEGVNECFRQLCEMIHAQKNETGMNGI
eukprot:TRINITY_DN1402_c0_g1_i2.p1 TRINITY_DN1402_c0_g1~~TRINITY_DN1402_c0_g1_i2.p1  ORF type:complete len:201 (-),score=32.67 TRINITY_DN1402_c0_g1_i2:53-655(-)